MRKKLLSMFLACCMLFSLLAVCAQADGAPLYVEYSDGDGVYASFGESGIGWDFQGGILTLNNFNGKYIALQFDSMYGDMEINLPTHYCKAYPSQQSGFFVNPCSRIFRQGHPNMAANATFGCQFIRFTESGRLF